MLPVKQLSRFGFVGVVATLVHVAVGLGLHNGLGAAPLIANLIGFVCALCVSFFGQTRLTFPRASADLGAFLRFVTVALTGLAVNQLIVWIVTVLLARPYWQALILIIGTVPWITFAMLKFWALRR